MDKQSDVSRALFAVGEVVILQSRGFPELNGEYPVLDVLHPGQSRQSGGVLRINTGPKAGYDLGITPPGHSGWWIESALRKRHQPGEYSLEDLVTSLHLPVSRDELQRLDREVTNG